MTKFLRAVFSAAALMLAASSSASVLTGKLSVDNGYTVYISTSNNVQGTAFGGGNDWMTTYTNSTTLVAGQTYYLHLFAYDQGVIAGFLGDFSLTGGGHKFSNGLTSLTTNTTDWMGNNSGFGSAYGAVSNLGTDGAAPWFNRPGISDSASWIWAGSEFTDANAYFTTTITAVPEPTSVALFGLALIGLGAARRRAAKQK